jgi:CxxC motif-containing protein (DUF1111 family)
MGRLPTVCSWLAVLNVLFGMGVTSQAIAESSFFTAKRDKNALDQPIGNLHDEALDAFILGRSFFTKIWVEAPASTTARDGLGPLFNGNSCTSCHQNNGGGNSLLKLSSDQSGKLHRSIAIKLNDLVYGSQIAVNANHGIPFEASVWVEVAKTSFTFPDGQKITLSAPTILLNDLQYGNLEAINTLGPRRAPMLTGLGLINRITESQILAYADPDDTDGDGISGKANRVWSLKGKNWQLGRFGWKASQPDILEQTANAFFEDMSLTSTLYKNENCTSHQMKCQQAYRSQNVDVPDARLEAVAFYLTNIKSPRAVKTSQGKTLFEDVGCSSCHRSNYKLEEDLVVNPYSDFLLHDMGPNLRDGLPSFEARPEEWRTAPLWGIGLAKTLNPDAGYLHDGRARTIEEAILWHSGEASQSQQKYTQLTRDERTDILNFLNNL